jgi:hypothetical protein
MDVVVAEAVHMEKIIGSILLLAKKSNSNHFVSLVA